MSFISEKYVRIRSLSPHRSGIANSEKIYHESMSSLPKEQQTNTPPPNLFWRNNPLLVPISKNSFNDCT